LNKVLDRYNDWRLKELDYDFKRIFVYVSVIYLLSLLFDFCLTFITFHFTPDRFFLNEISFVVKDVFNGSYLFFIVIVVLSMSPLIVGYGLNVYVEKKHGRQINDLKYVLFFINCVSVIHVWGGFTNFFHLISLEV